MSGTFVPRGNRNLWARPERPQQPTTVDEFAALLAHALGATVEQLQSGDGASVREIMTSVPRTLRLEYIALRKDGIAHKVAVKEINRLWERSKG